MSLTSRSPRLPQELYDCNMIIDFSFDEPSTLVACSLVSRTWLPSSRMHIFSYIEITLPVDISAFLAITSSELLDASRIPLLVRDLLVVGWNHYEPELYNVGLDTRLPGLLKKFALVKTLRLHTVRWTFGPSALLPAVADALMALASQVVHLHLHAVEFGTFDNALHFLFTSPRRCSLHLTSWGYSADKAIPWDAAAKQPLCKVVRIGTSVLTLSAYFRLYLTMREASVFHWPMSMPR
ncbi:uncharacterized protein C8Q71DRAFT_189269 [Rhodofomes roseus]|uniref:F-box domain-containing protein n=1 Tax=Rhodofomes roseus TaxID=34475 RepID=A0ABQ8K8Z0_9APHY|nr:uncharacterized protein C8Q71DRAFT_189269 [Rhodofomes roseus]KAH9833553.1 hypothetical protein C8Q71DRAFT_189269 [Rhodofomes roseus]